MLVVSVDEVNTSADAEAQAAAAHAEEMQQTGHFLRSRVEYAAKELRAGATVVEEQSDLLPVDQAVTALCGVKAVLSVAKKLEDALRKSLLQRFQPVANGAPVDERVYLSGEGKARIELRPSKKLTFVPERAAVLLKAAALYDEASERRVIVTEPQLLADKLREVQAYLLEQGAADLAESVTETLQKATTVETRLSEDRIGALVTMNKLTLVTAQRMYDTEVSHSVFDASQK